MPNGILNYGFVIFFFFGNPVFFVVDWKVFRKDTMNVIMIKEEMQLHYLMKFYKNIEIHSLISGEITIHYMIKGEITIGITGILKWLIIKLILLELIRYNKM